MHTVEILDTSGNVVAIIKNLVPFDKSNNVLEYDDFLSNYGECRFRVKTADPVLSSNFLEPYKYHIRIKKDRTVMWYGVIVNNTRRTHDFIEVEGRTLIFYFTKCEVKPSDLTTMTRVFKSGTMGTAIDTLFDEAVARGKSPISNFTVGTIQNPYKLNTTTAYTFTNTDFLELPFVSLMDVLTLCADITNSDFQVTTSKVFNFKRMIGSFKDVSFKWGQYGNIRDYDLPVNGSDAFNVLDGLAVSTTGKLVRSHKVDTDSLNDRKRLWSVKVFDNANTQKIVDSLTTEELRVKGDGTVFKTYSVNEDGYRLSLGDEFIVDIQDGIISERERRRLIGRSVKVNDTGFEDIMLITNRGKNIADE